MVMKLTSQWSAAMISVCLSSWNVQISVEHIRIWTGIGLRPISVGFRPSSDSYYLYVLRPNWRPINIKYVIITSCEIAYKNIVWNHTPNILRKTSYDIKLLAGDIMGHLLSFKVWNKDGCHAFLKRVEYLHSRGQTKSMQNTTQSDYSISSFLVIQRI